MGIGSILVAALIITGAGAGYYAVDEEYLPVNLSIREPVGCESQDLEDIYTDEYEQWVEKIPNIKNIMYEIFVSSTSIEDIRDDYDNRLTAKGYIHDYTGSTTICDDKCIDRRNMFVRYDGFVKGATGIGIVLVSATYFGGSNDETMVLYTTGNVADYQAISNYLWSDV